jgi:hypothetical protein
MTALWIVVIIFIVVAVGAGIAQMATAWGDKKISDDVTRDTGRLHADHREDHRDDHRDDRGDDDEHGHH